MQHTVEAVYFLKATQALHYVTYNWTTQYIKKCPQYTLIFLH